MRCFGDDNLTTDDLSQLLWAAQGVTGADGRRSVPSAGALYPIGLYAIIGRVTGLAPARNSILPHPMKSSRSHAGFGEKSSQKRRGGLDWMTHTDLAQLALSLAKGSPLWPIWVNAAKQNRTVISSVVPGLT